MNRLDVNEAAPIVLRLLKNLSGCIVSSGLSGSQARTAIGDVAADTALLLSDDALGAPLANCFNLVALSGATQPQIATVRVATEHEAPLTLGGVLTQNTGIRLCLATEGQIIARMSFVSRQDVDALKLAMRQPFDDAEEIAADDMDQATFMSLIALDAAITNFLVVTARPLPQMSAYQFAAVLPSLVIAHRLYQDASRADQIVAENKIVHPAFCPPTGIALSA
jgi:prophage DNA circulation protein